MSKNWKFCKILCLFASGKHILPTNEKKNKIEDSVPAEKGLQNNLVSNHYKNSTVFLMNSKQSPRILVLAGSRKNFHGFR